MRKKLIFFMGMAVLFLPFLSMASGGDKEDQSLVATTIHPPSYDLPRDQVLEYRALEAEKRAVQAETLLITQRIDVLRNEILEKWRILVGGNLVGWEIDLKEEKLKRSEIPK